MIAGTKHSGSEAEMYRYRTLSERRAEIRLLKILPGTDGSTLQCHLETFSLQDCSGEYTRYIPGSQNVDAAAVGDSLRNPDIRRRWKDRTEFANIAPMKRIASLQPCAELRRFVWGDFASLSYVWGNQSDTRHIYVNDKPVNVTANLESALRQFRSEGLFADHFLLWVDALCINQSNLRERAKEVQRMKDIYGSSWTVISWLGATSESSDAGLQLLRDMAAFREVGFESELEVRLGQDPSFLGSTCWRGLHQLINRDYWERLWIIQEIVMGGLSVLIKCGPSILDWETFCKGIAVLQEHLWLVKDRCLREDIARENRAWQTTSAHLIYQDLSVLHQTPLAENPRLAFGRLLDLAISVECTDPRDKVYALLGLIPDNVARLIQPDYTLSPAAVYTKAAYAFIEAYDSLDLLREANPWGRAGCPSWVPDWTWSGRGRHSRVSQPLWGPTYLFPPPQREPDPYRASGDTHQIVSISGGLLKCEGFIVDKISGLGAREMGYFDWDHDSRLSPRGWRSAYGDFLATGEALVSTLVHGRVRSGQRPGPQHNALLHLPSTFEEAWSQFEYRGWRWLAGQEGYYFRWEGFREAMDCFTLGDWHFRDFFDNHIPDDADEYVYTEVYACAERSSMRRRFMTTDKGYLGWAPGNMYGGPSDQVRGGDLIVIVLGCSTPLVIRPHGDTFQMLGEAYVQGLMDGEAMRKLADGHYELREFVFC
jgi:hypothetical protein